MTGSPKNQLHVPVHPVRFVTSAALFDGHDAAINIMRRILQAQGAEVVHLGHNRAVREVVDAVLTRMRRAWRSARIRAATSSTSSTWRRCCARPAPGTCGSSGAAAAYRP